MMRRLAAVLVLAACPLLCTKALAAEQSSRWVSAGGALSEWVVALGA